jgi:hypothetical protein
MDELLLKTVEHFSRWNDEEGNDVDVKSAIEHLDDPSWEYESYQNLLIVTGMAKDDGQVLAEDETLYFWGVENG